ncbi:hypothetical protein PoB_002340400 [Plakobranchus ocellatus]|uniref:Uncharacterized protein n=1 Tax=Plakobranchus ocellatus TaxID=259542 RepID=A0AAV3ZNK8_9GAST|nr:hypothetical protein PoB_002340400 [Plakobranchus ocellatus]
MLNLLSTISQYTRRRFMPYSRTHSARFRSTPGGGHALLSNLICAIPQYTGRRIMPDSRNYTARSHSTPGGGSCPTLAITLRDPTVHKEEDHALLSNLICTIPQ